MLERHGLGLGQFGVIHIRSYLSALAARLGQAVSGGNIEPHVRLDVVLRPAQPAPERRADLILALREALLGRLEEPARSLLVILGDTVTLIVAKRE